MLMSITLPDSRALLRLALASIALALGLGRAAVASEVTTPVEQLHAGLMAIMKARQDGTVSAGPAAARRAQGRMLHWQSSRIGRRRSGVR
jgi:hypothetical protein